MAKKSSSKDRVSKKGTKSKAQIKKKQPRRFRELRDLKNNSSPPDDSSNTSSFDWKQVEIIGEKPETVDKLKSQNHWDFSHLQALVESLLQTNPACDVFLAGGSPQPYSTSMLAECCPNILIFVVKSGYTPPEFVAIQDMQHAKDEIYPMRNKGLTWDPVPTGCFNSPGDGQVFMLRSLRRKANKSHAKMKAQLELEYLTLFTLKPSKEWTRKEGTGDLDIRHAQFFYEIEGEIIDEEFNKDNGHRLKSFISDFCDRYDLDEETHYDKIEVAIRNGFAKAREKVECRINLLSSKYPDNVLDNIQCVKVFPRNDCVKVKSNYVNKYYGRATSVK